MTMSLSRRSDLRFIIALNYELKSMNDMDPQTPFLLIQTSLANPVKSLEM
jgi:hypothetical protein